jgi:hypothetical protein
VTNGTSYDDLVGIFERESIVGIVEDYLDECVDGRRAGSLVEERLALFL